MEQKKKKKITHFSEITVTFDLLLPASVPKPQWIKHFEGKSELRQEEEEELPVRLREAFN